MPAPARSHQTISYLTRRFAEVGIRPQSRHGQNFLVDMNLQRLLVESAGLNDQDVVLEVGTGTGSLTAMMAPRVAAVVTVELDARLAQLAREELAGQSNVELLEHDALRNKSHLDPRVIQAVGRHLAAAAGRRLKLVANLPYSVATPVIANLLISPIVPHAMTVTVQKELAERITARPGTKDYGALSVWIRSQCRTELIRLLPPTVFWPRPQVTSAIIHVALDQRLRDRIGDLEFFHEFARRLFAHRRKYLRGALLAAWKGQLGKPAIDEILTRLGISPQARAEQLDVPVVLRLCDAFRDALGTLPEQD